MDFSYENNKALHAFFLSLVMILGLFTVFAPTSTYAATEITNTVKEGYPKASSFAFNDWVNTSKNKGYTNFYVYNYDSYGSKRTLYVAYGKGSSVSVDTTSNKITYSGSYVALSPHLGENVYDETKYNTNGLISTFDKGSFSSPPKPFPGQLAVKEVPGILAGQAGTIVLVGCLILGTLLVVGLVRRLISLFIR